MAAPGCCFNRSSPWKPAGIQRLALDFKVLSEFGIFDTTKLQLPYSNHIY